VTVNNVSRNPELRKNSITIPFVTQHRCKDPLFQELLDHIRHYRPTANVLKTLHGNRILSFEEPSDEDILKDMSDALILTVSRQATNRINRIATNNFVPRSTLSKLHSIR
jgi:hypothetical protein